MARLKYQAHRMQTPEERIRRMPATPALPKDVQSQELFRATSIASTTLDPDTPAAKQMGKVASKKKGKQGKTKPVKNGKKNTKKTRKTKTVKKQNKRKKGKAATATKKTTPLNANQTAAVEQPVDIANNAKVDTVPTLTPHMAEPVTPNATEFTSPAQSPASTAPSLAHAMTQLYVSSPAAPDMSAVPAEKLKSDPPAPAVPADPSTHSSAEPTEPVVKTEQHLVPVKKEPGETVSRSPKPESVNSLLNRAQTTDIAALEALVNKTVTNTLAATPQLQACTPIQPPASAGSSAVDDLPKIRKRDKAMHNRRMRFYRTLDSHLD